MRAPAVLVLVALAGCTVGPDYKRPDMAVPSQYAEPSSEGPAATAPVPPNWWTLYKDATLDELIGLHADVVQHLLSLTAPRKSAGDHVFTAHAELEGGKLQPMFERLLEGWQAQGYELVPTEAIFRALPPNLPICEVVYGEVPGRSGTLALQGKEVLS